MRFKFIAPALIFALIAVFLWRGLSIDPRLVPSPFIGKPAPAFDVPRLFSPEERFTQENLKGQVSLLNVWASWCPSCAVEHPFFNRLAAQKFMPIYGLNYKDEARDAKVWLAQRGNPYDAIAFDLDGRAGIEWGVYGAPETFLIDAEGIVRYKHVGAVDEQVWQEVFLPIISELRTGESS